MFSFNKPAATPGAAAPAFGAAAPAFGAAAPAFGAPQPATTQPAFGGFGAAPATNQPAFGGFGATPSTTQQAFGAAPAGGLFGGQPAAAPKFSFGAPATTAAPTLGGFGAQPAGGLFGAKPATTMPAAGGMFGAPQPAAGGMFGSGMGLGMQQQQQQLQLQQLQQQQQPQITDDIQRMAAYWNPQNPMCNFKHYFYNMVHPSEVQLYQPLAEDAAAYKQAQMNNPDPSCMVPVAAVGFGDLKKRMEVQEKHQAMQKDALEMMSARVDAIQRKHYVDTVIKLEEYKRRQRQIVHKVFMLMKQVQMLRNRGFSIRADEEALRSRLEAMERDLQKPSIFRGRLNEIWAKLQQLKDSKRISEDQGFAVVDEESLAPVAETLSGMTSGLAHVTQVLQSDLRKVDIMRQGYEQSAFARK